MKIQTKIGLLVFLLFLIPSLCRGGEEKGRVEVKDGDSFILHYQFGEIGVRLYGIDAPEWKQDFHDEAKEFTTRFLSEKKLKIEPVDRDPYGRTVGMVSVEGRLLNEELVKAGLAWVYPQYCRKSFCEKWSDLQEEARRSKRGLWASKNPIPPWEYRQEEKTAASHPKPGRKSLFGAFAPYHGNTSTRIFHKRGCPHYNCKQCTARFWSRNAALREGYSPCKICKP